MDFVTLLVDLLIGAWILAVLVAVVRAWQARTPRLVPLSIEARDRFVFAWHRIAAGFVDAPREAVEQADALVLALLREQGRMMRHGQLPKPIREARKLLARESADGTESLRQAMLHYRSMFTGLIGRRPPDTERQEASRREMA